MKVSVEIDNAKIELEDNVCTARDGEFYFDRCKAYLVLAVDQLIRVLDTRKEDV